MPEHGDQIAEHGVADSGRDFGFVAQHYGWPTVFILVAATYALCALSWLAIDSTIPVLEGNADAKSCAAIAGKVPPGMLDMPCHFRVSQTGRPMHHRLPACSLAVALTFAAHSHADDWPQFRGPNCTGIAHSSKPLPVNFSATENVRWSQRIGDGIGSTVLPGDRASKNFFESFGLVARAIAVHRDLRS